MATTAMEMPVLLTSYGHSMSRVPRYKKVMKLPKKQPNLQEKRDIKQPDTSESSALQKVGAFGVSVKKNQLATEYLKQSRVASDRQTSPIKELVEEEENAAEEEENNKYNSDNKRLPTVEFSIRKKIKRRIMIRHVVNTEALASKDKQVLEDLRNDLRTQTKEHRGGERSILEAIGDPKIRESRLFYEPLKEFLGGNEKPGVGKQQRKTPFLKTANGYAINNGFPSDIRLVNTSVPPSKKHFNTPTDPRFAQTFNNSSPFRAASKQSYPNFPKVPNNRQFRSKTETRETHPRTTLQPGDQSQPNYTLSPSSGVKNESENGRKTEFSLPFISLHMQEGDAEQQIISEEQKRVAKRKLYTQPIENKRASRANRPRNGRPQPQTMPRSGYVPGVKLTPSGKAHLIGPMNKMDMIVEYSKLLQSKVINYEQYVNKLSKLSLHKIDLGNSGLRHYHIVRDGTTGMKPSLARVDIYPSRDTGEEFENVATLHDKMMTRTNKHKRGHRWAENAQRDKTATAEYHRVPTVGQSRNGITTSLGGQDNTPYDPSSPYKNPSQLRMSRVSIGEGIPDSQIEHYNTGYDVGTDEYLTYDDVIRMQGTDMDRYRHAHRPHPNEKHPFHWSHVPPNTSTGKSGIRAKGELKYINPSAELYNGYSGKLLPNSREIKKRLNFSYPSYDVAVDGTNNPLGEGTVKTMTSSQELDKVEDTNHDPDYLAITLDQQTERAPSPTEPVTVTSSLSVHDVTIPTEVKVITGAMPQKTNGFQRKGLITGPRDPLPKDTSSSPFKGSLDILNITPVAITSSNAVNPRPGSNKTPYYVSEDDFVTTGTDGVLQTHLNTIYKSINKAKANKSEEVNQAPSHPGKNSPPNVHITKMVTKKNSLPQDVEKVVTENAKLLQPNKRLPPPNTPPPKVGMIKQDKINEEPQTEVLIVPDKKENMTSQASTSSGVSSTLSIPKIPLVGSPPPTAYLLQSREDEITSAESDDDMNDVITLNMTNAQTADVTRVSPESQITLMVPTGVNATEVNNQLSSKLEVVISS